MTTTALRAQSAQLPARPGTSTQRPPAEAVATRGVQRLAAGAEEGR